MVSEVATTVRFTAPDVLALFSYSLSAGHEGLWFIRGKECYLTSPDLSRTCKPKSISGDYSLVYDERPQPRVEILSLHNHVLRVLHSSSGIIYDSRVVDINISTSLEFFLELGHVRGSSGGFKWFQDSSRVGGLI